MTNPVALATNIWGDGSRRALLLHGLTSAGSTWWRTAADLAGKGFTVVAPDLRSHGRSPAGDSVSIEAYRDDVLLLGGGWDVLLGHSLGGAVAAAVVSSSPDFAARLVLEDPAIDSDITARFVALSPEPVANPTIAAVAAEHPNWHPRDVEYKVEALLASGPDITERTMTDGAPWDVWPSILALTLPTLILAADPSLGSLVSVEKAAETGDTPIQFERIPGAGHSIHRDAFDEFVSHIHRFVGS